MKKSLILLCIIFLCTSVHAQTFISGTISRDSVLTKKKSPYMVTGNLTVNNGVTLKADSGVVIRFKPNTGLYVYGKLKARHTVFTSHRDSTGSQAQKGDWDFIQIGTSSYGNISADLDTCIIRYGGTSSNQADYASLYVYRGNVNLRGCEIYNSKNYGLHFNSDVNIRLLSSKIYNCEWPIVYQGPGSLVMEGSNTFMSNVHNGIYMSFTSLSTQLKLDTASVPYVFGNTMDIAKLASLEIASGNILKFAQNVGISVYGSFKAVAGSGKNIWFTSYKDDNLGGDTNGDGTSTSPKSNDWGAIKFFDESNDAACIMKRCYLTFGGYYNAGVITAENSSPVIDSCQMANNYYGAMFVNAANPVFSNNTIGSSQVVPIAMSFNSFPVFQNNTFSFSDNQYDAIGLLGGTLTSDAVLPIRNVTGIPNVTYLMLDQVTIPKGRSLTINKGVVIKAPVYHHRIIVQGRLTADATADSMITFTSSKDDNFGNPGDSNKDGSISAPAIGDWSGIVFEEGSDSSSVLNYCRIKYASLYSGYFYGQYYNSGAITVLNSSPSITNCEIKDVQYGLMLLKSSKPKLHNLQIVNTSYTPVAMSVSADPDFSNLKFTNAKWTALGIVGEHMGYNGRFKKRNIAGYDNITYMLLWDLYVDAGTKLTVDPGVVVKFADDAAIFVDGAFSAKGLPSSRITFTSVKDDNFGNPKDTNGDGAATTPALGDWETIRFQDTSLDSINLIKYCDVKFGGRSSYGNITFNNAGGRILQSVLSDSYYFGVRCDGNSNPLIDSSEIRNCRLDPVAMSLKADPQFPTFTGVKFVSNGSNGIKILEGTLSSNARLAKRDVAGISNIGYIINSDMTISSNAVLTIEPGVVLKFSEYWNSITVNGALVANGSQSQKIIFTSLRDDNYGGDTNNDGNNSAPGKSNWRGVILNNSALDTLNSFKYCEFYYGGYGPTSSDYRDMGLLRISNCRAKVQNTSFAHSSSTGLNVLGSAEPVIANCEINNVDLTPVGLSMFSKPVFENITFANAALSALGIVPENYSNDAVIPVRNFAGYNNITYYLFGMSTVNSGTAITIPEGVVFKSNNNVQFRVDGALIVSGSPAKPVVFTSTGDDMYGNPMDTNGDGSASSPYIYNDARIVYNDISDDNSSRMRHAILRYSNYGITLVQASPKISNCTFSEGQYGVVLTGVSKPVIDSCSFNDLSRTPIIISLASYPASTVNNRISGSTYKAIGVRGETLTQDFTLSKKNFAGITNIPYYFSENYTVGTSVTMTIAPGVICKFEPQRGLDVKKGLVASGGSTLDSNIVFTDIRDDFYGGDTNADSTKTVADGYRWNGITFSDESIDQICRLENCVIRNAGYYYQTSGAIITNSASPTIKHCTITKSTNGVVVNAASNPKINYCDIYENEYYGINNINKSFVVDARYNWWGSNSGPKHSSNPGGSGQEVTSSVNFTPFLTNGAYNPIAGDVSLNGKVQSYDASLILKYVVSPSGPDSLNDLQRRVADVSANGSIQAYDASLILQYVVGGLEGFPGELHKNSVSPSQERIKQYLALQKVTGGQVKMTGAKAENNSEIALPVTVSGIKGMTSAEAVIKYPADKLEFTGLSVSDAFGSMTITYSDDKSKGEVHVAAASGCLLPEDGELFRLSFKTGREVKGSTSAQVSFDRFIANETDLSKSAAAASIEIQGLPVAFRLEQNYPNPFNPTTTIKYEVPENNSAINIAVYNSLGELVKTLVSEVKNAGRYEVSWEGTDQYGGRVASGMYICRIQSGKFSQSRKMMLLK